MDTKMKFTEKRDPLLEVRDLKKHFKVPRRGMLHAVDGVNFSIYEGETLGLVGESGCGKSTVGNLLIGLLDATDGQMLYRGEKLASLKKRTKANQSGMQIVFQDPYSSLNPRKTIKKILSEPFEIHHEGSSTEIDQKVRDLCKRVDIPETLLDHYPHELDGGMRQVVGIARALSRNPEFIICDEPVSSLDVSIQAKIINLLMDIQKSDNLTYLFISHDLSVVRHISSRIAVMYLGQIVEMAETDTLFEKTLHPYSIALLSAVPHIGETKTKRIVLKGDVPSPMNPKPGCRFAQRCWMAQDSCFKDTPELKEVEPGHFVACHLCKESRERMKHVETTSLEGNGVNKENAE